MQTLEEYALTQDALTTLINARRGFASAMRVYRDQLAAAANDPTVILTQAQSAADSTVTDTGKLVALLDDPKSAAMLEAGLTQRGLDFGEYAKEVQAVYSAASAQSLALSVAFDKTALSVGVKMQPIDVTAARSDMIDALPDTLSATVDALPEYRTLG